MNIKKFTGSTMQEIMAQVKSEFGEDAMIIQSKKVKKGGVLGLFTKEYIEVMAAVETDRLRSKKRTDNREKIAADESKNKNYNNINTKVAQPSKPIKEDSVVSKKNELQPRKNNFRKEMMTFRQEDFIPDENESLKLTQELEEIKTVVNQLNTRFIKTFVNDEEEAKEMEKKRFIQELEEMGISERLSAEIVEETLSRGDKLNDKNLIETIDKKFGKLDAEGYNSIVSKYNIFVGPTGVGKTTTLAKLASEIAIRDNKRIGFLTLDTYRISAVEQLKTYAEILNSPIEVAYDIGDIRPAIERLENRDIIFIDTAGRSHKNHDHMQELRETLAAIEQKDVFLTIAANYNIEDVRNLIDTYDFLEDFNIIVTKLDETDRFGIVLDIMDFCGKKPVFITYGQNVPDDIEPFRFERFVKELFMEKNK